jgi:hypothetical protein
MQKINGKYMLYGNELSVAKSRATDRWQHFFVKKFNYDPEEQYHLHIKQNEFLSDELGIKDILRTDQGNEIPEKGNVVISTIRMGYGHYRIAMAGASAARAMGYTPLWLDLLAIPGITTDVISWCNTNYSRFSRISQRNKFFNRYIWEILTTGNKSLPIINGILNHWIVTWPWRFLKTNIKDYKMSELFRNLYEALPPDIPMLTSHMWNAMGAVAGGMKNVVDMVFDNWPMAFQLTEGAKHGIQSPSAYYGFRTMRGFDDKGKIMKPAPADAVYYTGAHIDHELVENIEIDNTARIRRMRNNEPCRVLLTMGGAGAQRELFKAIIEYCLPLVKKEKMALFVNLGDHVDNWEWLQVELKENAIDVMTYMDWHDTKAFIDFIREESVSGIHVFLHNNTFHAVYSTNYLMRVVDVMITKPSELAFYPIPKIFNARVGGHEMWGAIRGAEMGDGTVEAITIPQTLQAIDMLVNNDDVLEIFCNSIVKNKRIGIYDGAYNCVALATGTKWER